MKTWIINGHEYQMVPEMTMGVFSQLDEIMRDLFDKEGRIPMEKILKFTRDSQRLKDMAMLILVPVKKPSWIMRIFKYDKWRDLQHITIHQLLEVISDFFSLRGPLQNAFLGVLSPLEEENSKQTPSTVSEA